MHPVPPQLPSVKDFDTTITGQQVSLYLLRNSGTTVAVTNFGGRIVSLFTTAGDNTIRDVVAGFDSIDGYLNSSEVYHGTIAGRYANRIAGGCFNLHGKEHLLSVNNGQNHLHGGPQGFHNKVWNVIDVSENTIVLEHISKDGEEGYPGNLKTTVTYTVLQNGIRIQYTATTDAPTILNLTNHSYFNLDGGGGSTIHNHRLWLNADKFTPVNEHLIPTGEMALVSNTPFDFRELQTIGSRIHTEHQQLQYGRGYDHNFILNKKTNELSVAGAAWSSDGKLKMEVLTTQPGIQFYSGNFMQGQNMLKGGYKDEFQSAFCLETQHFPDSPNQPSFPTTVLEKGETFTSETQYLFSAIA